MTAVKLEINKATFNCSAILNPFLYNILMTAVKLEINKATY